ncbi:hypothetical protein SXCC_04232 [Gluconacetobacter sp. SXCC-1]|nr:hypothetical protein SXCC_04232 [Gluconacetobacter sp. SXCC-1]
MDFHCSGLSRLEKQTIARFTRGPLNGTTKPLLKIPRSAACKRNSLDFAYGDDISENNAGFREPRP